MWRIDKFLCIKGNDVARTKAELPPAASGDAASSDKAPKKPRAPRKTADVKVVKGRVEKMPPAKASKKPVSGRAKQTAAASSEQPAKKSRATGNTRVRNAVNLSKKEHEALQAGALHGLDERQAKFIDLWLVTQNATQAYIDAGYECKNEAVAAAAASRLLRRVKEHPYTLAKRAELFAKTEEITGRVIERIYGAAMADPRELVEYVYRCCRFCHGIGHQYQMTPNQQKERQERHKIAQAEAKAEKRRLPPYDDLGGVGFDATRDPHENCPECFGKGVGHLELKDTRHLSPGALALYGGVEETKDGLKMRVADPRPYLELLGRIYSMNIEPTVKVVQGATKEELDAAHERGRAATAAQREKMAERAAQIAALDDGGDQ